MTNLPEPDASAAPPLDTEAPFGDRAPDGAALEAWRLATDPDLPAATRKANRKRIAGGRRGPFDVTVEELRFRAYPAENRCDRVMVGRGMLPEPREHELLARFVGEGAVFIDIGANVGAYALWAARRVGPAGTVIALEPHPRTFAKLCFNRTANGAGNLRCLNVAAGPDTGTATLSFDGGGNVGGASLLAGPADSGVGMTVAVSSLADILSEQKVGRTDVVKVDVEGYEDRALLPYFGRAPRGRWPKTIMIETALSDRWERDCLAGLARLGYERAAATAENVILNLAG